MGVPSQPVYIGIFSGGTPEDAFTMSHPPSPIVIIVGLTQDWIGNNSGPDVGYGNN